MERQRQLGTILMALAGVQMLIFLIGVMRRSYLAIALPVVAAMSALCGVLFWVGYTMSTMKPGLSDLDMEEEVYVEPEESIV
jgi:arginine exporter protein ArgO